MMIEKLMQAEHSLQQTLSRAQIKLLAFMSIKKLLSEVDFKVEEIPDDPDRFIQLLISLKGSQLTSLELELINELVDADSFTLIDKRSFR